MAAAAAPARAGAFGRVWAAYLRQLNRRPLRTKMITSGSMFLLGDTVAQFGIEGRRVGATALEDGESEENRTLPWDVSSRAAAHRAHRTLLTTVAHPRTASLHLFVTAKTRRLLRLALTPADGGLIFAPLAHTWLGWLDKVSYPSKMKSECGVLKSEFLCVTNSDSSGSTTGARPVHLGSVHRLE